MIFKQLNPDACKTYLFADERTKKAVLIDPVIIFTDNYLNLFKTEGYSLTHVIDTHTHADHISAAPTLVAATGCIYVMHNKAPAKCVTKHVTDGDILEAAGQTLKFLYTPGHTGDSISILLGDKLLTGDFLFLDDGGAGRDDLPGGSPSEHWDSFQKLNCLPDSLMIYPAHDYRGRKPSDLGNQRNGNPHLKERTKKDFIHYINDLKLGPAEWMKAVLKANFSCSTDPGAAYIPEDTPACEVMGTIDPELKKIILNFISPEELNSMLRQNKKPLLLDVRESVELHESLGQIDGIINIPVAHLLLKLDKLKKDKNNTVIVICHTGLRAETAGRQLVHAGFTDIRVLRDGMVAWKNFGF